VGRDRTGSYDAAVATAIEQHMAWLLERIVDRGAGLTTEEMAEHLVPRDGRQLEGLRGGFGMWGDRVGDPMVVHDRAVADDGLTATTILEGERGRRWELTCRLDSDDGEIGSYSLERCLPEGVEIRDATPDDAGALADLYRSIPMVAGDLQVTIDIGDDYFASTRLMPESRTLIATDHGRAIGLYTGTRFPSMLNGRECTVILGCHTRIDAGKAGGGVWSRMNRQLVDHFSDHYDAAMAFVLTGNTAASRLTTAGAWPAGPVRTVIACGALDVDAGSPCRPATPDDAEEIADILNETHGGRELFRPYTAESLAGRLERAPDIYGWGSVWITDGAVVGVGERFHHRVTKSPTEERHSTRAIVYDYGYRVGTPGSEAAFLALLGARARAVAAVGATHLSIFTTEPAPAYATLARLADSLEQYDLLVPPVPPDTDAETRGVYVDQAIF